MVRRTTAIVSCSASFFWPDTRTTSPCMLAWVFSLLSFTSFTIFFARVLIDALAHPNILLHLFAAHLLDGAIQAANDHRAGELAVSTLTQLAELEIVSPTASAIPFH